MTVAVHDIQTAIVDRGRGRRPEVLFDMRRRVVLIEELDVRLQVRLFPCRGLDRVGVQKLSSPLRNRRFTPQGLHECALGVQHLNAMVPPVGHVDVSILVYAHVGRTAKLTVTPAPCAVCSDEFPSGVKPLDAVVAPIGHVDIILAV